MLHKPKDEAVTKRNGPTCEVKEFGGIASIDGADIVIDGRYPAEGYSVNKASSFVIRVLNGTGTLAVRGYQTSLTEGDVAFVENGEAYYFEGQNLAIFMACTPAWAPEQYTNVE